MRLSKLRSFEGSASCNCRWLLPAVAFELNYLFFGLAGVFLISGPIVFAGGSMNMERAMNGTSKPNSVEECAMTDRS